MMIRNLNNRFCNSQRLHNSSFQLLTVRKYHHIPVLLHECIDNLNVKPGKLYVDCTIGGGGHSK